MKLCEGCKDAARCWAFQKCQHPAPPPSSSNATSRFPERWYYDGVGTVCDGDFGSDACLDLTGDFAGPEEKKAFADEIVRRLNGMQSETATLKSASLEELEQANALPSAVAAPDIGHVLAARKLWRKFRELEQDCHGDAQEAFIRIVAPMLARTESAVAPTYHRLGLIKDSLQEAQKAAKLMLGVTVGESYAFWQLRYNEATAALDALESLPSSERDIHAEAMYALARRCGWNEVSSKPPVCFIEEAMQSATATPSRDPWCPVSWPCTGKGCVSFGCEKLRSDSDSRIAGMRCQWCNSDPEEAAKRYEGPHATWCPHYRFMEIKE